MAKKGDCLLISPQNPYLYPMVKIPYGTSHFGKLISQGFYYIDRTPFIEQVEQLGEQYIAFLRPRRFGKSLWISTLQHYYGYEHRQRFEALFGACYIGQHPTPLANAYLVLKLDFSGILTDSLESTQRGFVNNVKSGLRIFRNTYQDLLPGLETEHINACKSANEALQLVLEFVQKLELKQKVYVLIDEYDHFANELIAFHYDNYQDVVSRNGYVR
ncbi:MAG: AAA family ATPase, partial [Bacteroidetes bacterium]